jgi:hypothetical protein
VCLHSPASRGNSSLFFRLSSFCVACGVTFTSPLADAFPAFLEGQPQGLVWPASKQDTQPPSRPDSLAYVDSKLQALCLHRLVSRGQSPLCVRLLSFYAKAPCNANVHKTYQR